MARTYVMVMVYMSHSDVTPDPLDPWQRWLRQLDRGRLHLPHYRQAAVLVALTRETSPRVLLTVRSSTMPTHQGQISFPGGGLRAQETPTEAALREAWEEVGLDSQEVTVLGELSDVSTPAGFHVTPILARLEAGATLNLSHEVAALLQPPLAELRATEQLVYSTGPDGAPLTRYRYPWQGHDIWGMTAAVLHQVLHSGVQG